MPLQITCMPHDRRFSSKIGRPLSICNGLPNFCNSGDVLPQIKIKGATCQTRKVQGPPVQIALN